MLDNRKCSLGYGTRLVVISFKSTFKDPSKRMELVKLVSKRATILFISPNALVAWLALPLALDGAGMVLGAVLFFDWTEAAFPPVDDASRPVLYKCSRAFKSIWSDSREPFTTAGDEEEVLVSASELKCTLDDDDFSIFAHMSMSASFSMGSTQSACSVSSRNANTLLYGDVITSSSSDGKMQLVNRYTSGKWSSRRPRMYVPSPDPIRNAFAHTSEVSKAASTVDSHCSISTTVPVPPPMEWITKNDCNESHSSTARWILPSKSSLYFGPYRQWPCALTIYTTTASHQHERHSPTIQHCSSFSSPVVARARDVREELLLVEQLSERSGERFCHGTLLHVDEDRARLERLDRRLAIREGQIHRVRVPRVHVAEERAHALVKASFLRVLWHCRENELLVESWIERHRGRYRRIHTKALTCACSSSASCQN